MAPVKILAIDDDPAIRTLIHRYLSQQNYQVECAGDGKTALELFNKFSPDLVVLDVNLPDTTGFQLCKKMKSNTNVFVLMLTSLPDEGRSIFSLLNDFEEGADDYITKPFGLVELGARVGAILRRQRLVSNSQPEVLQLGNMTIDPQSREVKVDGELIALTALEFDILHCLAGEPGRAWRRSDLIQEAWYEHNLGDARVVDVHIGRIRKKLENNNDNPPKIKAVRGIGYKLDV